jgi:hypothetical protein
VFWRFIIGRIVASNKKLNVTLLFDEALAAGRIPDVSTVLETARSKNVSVVFGVQHTAGIHRVYREDAEGLISGFATRIWLLNGLAINDQELMRKSLGTRVVEEPDGKGKKDRIAVDLLTVDDLSRRANQYRKFWAVIDANGATKSGARILGQLVGVAGLTRQPTEEEAAAEVAASEASSPQEFFPTPDLAIQEAVAALDEKEIAAARDFALQLKGALLASPQKLEAQGWKVVSLDPSGPKAVDPNE